MTNLQKLVDGLGGILVTDQAEQIPDEALRFVACPFDAGDDGTDCDEHDGYPSAEMCAACKRKWLAAKA